jgi:hypothetical protein
MDGIVWDGKPFKRACSACGSMDWTEIRTAMEGMEIYDCCSQCPNPVQTGGVPDVYFRHPYKSESLDMEFTSKKQKANYLKSHNLSEAGDRKMSDVPWIEGTRSYRKRNFEKDRPMIRENYRRYLQNAPRSK